MKLCFYLLVFVFTVSTATITHGQNVLLDNTFSDDGIVTKDFYNRSDIAYSLTVLPSGKIVIAGTIQVKNGTFDFAVARINDDGTFDNTFSADGITTTDIKGADGTDYGLSVAVQANNKIVVGGWTFANNDFAMVRYNEDGSLDQTFGTGGIVTTNIGTNDKGNSIALQSDGKIILSGYSYGGNTYDFAVVRYDTIGNIDKSFENNGKVTTDIANDRDYGMGMAIQKDDKIIVAGSAKISSRNNLAVVRYNKDGSLDTSFDNDGKAMTLINGKGINGNSAAVAIQQDDKIVIACSYSDDTYTKIGVVRFNSDGSLDSDWGTKGIVQTSVGNYDDEAFGIAIQPDNKILVTGYTYSSKTMNDFFIIRYNTDGSPDMNFDSNGIFIKPIGSDYSYDTAYGITVADDKIIVCGTSEVEDENENDFTVVRVSIQTASAITDHDTQNKIFLSQNYPNPFCSSTTIQYTIPISTANVRVQLKIYDVLGKEVTTLVNKEQTPGTYSVRFNAEKNMKNGIYFYSLTAGELHSVKKMSFMK